MESLTRFLQTKSRTHTIPPSTTRLHTHRGEVVVRDDALHWVVSFVARSVRFRWVKVGDSQLHYISPLTFRRRFSSVRRTFAKPSSSTLLWAREAKTVWSREIKKCRKSFVLISSNCELNSEEQVESSSFFFFVVKEEKNSKHCRWPIKAPFAVTIRFLLTKGVVVRNNSTKLCVLLHFPLVVRDRERERLNHHGDRVVLGRNLP